MTIVEIEQGREFQAPVARGVDASFLPELLVSEKGSLKILEVTVPGEGQADLIVIMGNDLVETEEQDAPSLARYWATEADSIMEVLKAAGSPTETHPHLIAYIATKTQANGSVEIKRLYVRPSWRRKRIGPALLWKTIETAAKKGCPYLFLDSSGSSLTFYKKHGWVRKEKLNQDMFAWTPLFTRDPSLITNDMLFFLDEELEAKYKPT